MAWEGQGMGWLWERSEACIRSYGMQVRHSAGAWRKGRGEAVEGGAFPLISSFVVSFSHLVFQGISVSSVCHFGWPGFGMDLAASSLVASCFFFSFFLYSVD
jgi:hypothetical protein